MSPLLCLLAKAVQLLLLFYIIYLVFQLKTHAYLYKSTPRSIVEAEAAPGPGAAWLPTSDERSNPDVKPDGASVGATLRRKVKNAIKTRQSTPSPMISLDSLTHHSSRAPSIVLHESAAAGPGRRPSLHDQERDTTGGTGDMDPDTNGTWETNPNARRPIGPFRQISSKPWVPPVFTEMEPEPSVGSIPRVRYGIIRTNSLPGRVSFPMAHISGAPLTPHPRMPIGEVIDDADLALADGDVEEGEKPLSQVAAILLLVTTVVCVSVCAESLVDSISRLQEETGAGDMFLGLIILPIVGNAAEHFTAVTVALKNKMDLAVAVAIGSSIQIALFITPVVVLVAWALGKTMTLTFTLFETMCLFMSVFVVNFLVLDGRSTYLQGILLCGFYFIIAVMAFYFPTSAQMGSGIVGPDPGDDDPHGVNMTRFL